MPSSRAAPTPLRPEGPSCHGPRCPTVALYRAGDNVLICRRSADCEPKDRPRTAAPEELPRSLGLAAANCENLSDAGGSVE